MKKESFPSKNAHIEPNLNTLMDSVSDLKSDVNTFKTPTRVLRGKFCKLARNAGKHSVEDLMTLLEKHPDWSLFIEKYPSLKEKFYVINSDFILKFEENALDIIEFFPTGFLFGMGFPSYEFTRLVAKVCDLEKEHLFLEDSLSKNTMRGLI
jgi:hypothetical protein